MSEKSCANILAILVPLISISCVPATVIDGSGGDAGVTDETGGHSGTGTSGNLLGGNSATGGAGGTSLGGSTTTAGNNATGGTASGTGGSTAGTATGGHSNYTTAATETGGTSNALATAVGGSAAGGTSAVSMTTATGGTTSAATGGTTSAATGGTTSAATGGTTSAATGGTTSAATGGTTSAATGGTTSAATGGTSSAATGGATTAATGGTLASTTAGTATGGDTGGTVSGGSSSTGGATTSTGGSCAGSLPAPSGLQATNATSDTKIGLQWTSVSCADKYEVVRATDPAGTFTSLGQTIVNAYDDLNAQDTISYYYKVRAYSNAAGYGAYSDVATGSRKQGYYLVTSWGSSGSGDGQFSSPYNIAFDSSSNVYVLDTYNHRVQKFDVSGNLLTKWGGNTISGEAGKFYYPKAITVSGNFVYVGDDAGYVQRFGLDGTYVDRFSVAQAVELDDIDSDASGNLYVAAYLWAQASATGKLYKYNPSYALLTSWGSSGEGAGQFAGAIQIAVDGNQSVVYAADTGHSKIEYFTLSGTYANAWGSTGTGDTQFDEPVGVAVDTSGAVYVADSGNGRVQKFTIGAGSATLVASFDSAHCRELAVDASTGKVAVIDMNEAQVRIYQRR